MHSSETPASTPADAKPAPEPGERIMKYFKFEHLKDPLRSVSEKFAELAHWIVANVPPGPERTVSLRKLMESKDAGVRARMD